MEKPGTSSWWEFVKYPTLDGLANAATSVATAASETASKGAALVNETLESSETLSAIKDTVIETAATVADGAGSMAAEAGRVAERFRLEEAIMTLKQEIEITKRRWGSGSWAAMVEGDLATVRANFERAKTTVDRLQALLQARQAELSALEEDEDDELYIGEEGEQPAAADEQGRELLQVRRPPTRPPTPTPQCS